MDDTIHLNPNAALSERVLLPGDPGRALLLAQALLEKPLMFNHNRGLWGYTGTAADGEPLTIQSTGMGGPSAAIVISELIDLGARRLIRTGTCGALDQTLNLGELLVVTEAIAADGTSRALGAGAAVVPDAELTAALAEGQPPPATPPGAPLARPPQPPPATGAVVSTDLFYDSRDDERAWREAGARAVEMECATLFALANRRGLAAASVLIVTDLLEPARTRIEPEALRVAEHRLGHLAADALGAYSVAGTPAADAPAA